MKNLLVVLTLALVMISCNQNKIAYVDMEEIMKEYSGSKLAEEKMQVRSQEISQQFNQIAGEFQAKYQQYQEQRASLSEAERNNMEQQLMQEQQMIQQRQQMAQQQFQIEGNQVLDTINNEISSFIEKYAKGKGIGVVLGTTPQTRSVIYAEENMNITADIIESLNSQEVKEEATETPIETEVVSDSVK